MATNVVLNLPDSTCIFPPLSRGQRHVQCQGQDCRQDRGPVPGGKGRQTGGLGLVFVLINILLRSEMEAREYHYLKLPNMPRKCQNVTKFQKLQINTKESQNATYIYRIARSSKKITKYKKKIKNPQKQQKQSTHMLWGAKGSGITSPPCWWVPSLGPSASPGSSKTQKHKKNKKMTQNQKKRILKPDVACRDSVGAEGRIRGYGLRIPQKIKKTKKKIQNSTKKRKKYLKKCKKKYSHVMGGKGVRDHLPSMLVWSTFGFSSLTQVRKNTKIIKKYSKSKRWGALNYKKVRKVRLGYPEGGPEQNSVSLSNLDRLMWIVTKTKQYMLVRQIVKLELYMFNKLVMFSCQQVTGLVASEYVKSRKSWNKLMHTLYGNRRDRPGLVAASWNCRMGLLDENNHPTSKRHSIANFLSQYNIDILAVSEAYLHGNRSRII